MLVLVHRFNINYYLKFPADMENIFPYFFLYFSNSMIGSFRKKYKIVPMYGIKYGPRFLNTK